MVIAADESTGNAEARSNLMCDNYLCMMFAKKAYQSVPKQARRPYLRSLTGDWKEPIHEYA